MTDSPDVGGPKVTSSTEVGGPAVTEAPEAGGQEVGGEGGRPLVVQKLFYGGEKSYRWTGTLMHRDERHLFFTAVFAGTGRDLGYVTFETNDIFYEYYYFDRWYNVFQVYAEDGRLKGWYCNVTAPPEVRDDELTFVDLALDLFVYPDLRFLILDQEEFDELARTTYSPEHVERAKGALAELIDLAKAGALPGRPFDGPLPLDGPSGG